MIKKIFFAICIALFIGAAPFSIQGDSVTTIVYITNSGKKYHAGGCKFLAKSKIKTTLEKVQKGGYTPCSVCKPGR